MYPMIKLVFINQYMTVIETTIYEDSMYYGVGRLNFSTVPDSIL